MSVLVWVGVVACSGAASVARFALDTFVSTRVRGEDPWGTLAVNLSGAFLLGLLVGLAVRGNTALLLSTATLGSYTTFSTWMLESQRLGEEGRNWSLLANLLGSLVLGVAAVALGRVIGGAL